MTKQEKVEARLQDFFGLSLVSNKVVMMGTLCLIDVVYKDFLPIKDVRRWIDENIPDVLGMDIERTYSNDALKKVLLELYEENSELQMETASVLFSRSFCQGV